MPSTSRKVSMRRTMRDSSRSSHTGRSLDMSQPLQYSPTRPVHMPDMAPPIQGTNRLSGQTFAAGDSSPETYDEATTRKPARFVHDEEKYTGDKGKKRIDYLSRAQKYRLSLKNHVLAMIGEFVGTVLFLFFAYAGASVANVPSTSITGATTTANGDGSSTAAATVQAPNTSSLQFIALSFGFSLTVNAWVFFRISGGLFNPAVSFALALVGVITPVRAILLSISQFLGGITAAAIIQAILPGPLYITTRLATNMSRTRGVFLEMFLTAMLMLAILLLAAEKSKTTFLAPVGIGLALFITQLAGVYWTGASVNPCRTLGPDVVIRSFPTYAWIYYVGPYAGATIAAGFYLLMKKAHYETVVPGQDADGEMPVQVAAVVTAQGGISGRRGSAYPVDEISGPGISDYSTPAVAKGNLGADLTSARAPTRFSAVVPQLHPGEHQY